MFITGHFIQSSQVELLLTVSSYLENMIMFTWVTCILVIILFIQHTALSCSICKKCPMCLFDKTMVFTMTSLSALM